MTVELQCDLPDRPSELIRLALADLKRVEEDPRYIVNMSEWHTPRGRTCSVCLAGSVLAKTCGAPVEEDFLDIDVSRDTARKLYALDKFRLGHVHLALGYFRTVIISPDVPSRLLVTAYSVSPEAFHADMENMATVLERAGL